MIWSFFLVLAELINFQPTGKVIFNQKFGQLDDDSPLIKKFISIIPSLKDYDSGSHSIGKIEFIYGGYDDLLFVVCADKTDTIVPIAQAIENIKVAFSQKFFNLIKEGKDDSYLFRPFKIDVEKALMNINQTVIEAESALAPSLAEKAAPISTNEKKLVKITFIGAENVGKRTLLNLLYSGSADSGLTPDESEMMMRKGPISDKYSALLITMPNEMIDTGKTQFLSNTDIVLFVTSSNFRDMMATRKIFDKIKSLLPNARYGLIANKQDAPDIVDLEAIRKVYDLPIIPMVAIDTANYEMLKMFVEELIEGY